MPHDESSAPARLPSDAAYAGRLMAVFGAGIAVTWALIAAAFSNLLPLNSLGLSLTMVQLAVNLLVAAAAFLVVRARKDLSGIAVLQVIVALVISFVEISVDATFTWFFAAGLLIWAFKLKDLLVALAASASVAVAAFVVAMPTQVMLLPTVVAVAAAVVVLASAVRLATARR
ncbi:hypothetical protein [Zhihengliuella salsuginis]|uniref:Uncharacterized protein n=1 Tax=Zhihengliuella salsuginis TaxID=578222 RepID=A0ABQ3GIV8_9MICC|nr:hypothetical protein [Zhihengliuella salsuginis]GHD04883.1 hypothetical protein GCM10008096_12860 [Zhihengliuella salsuginis]